MPEYIHYWNRRELGRGNYDKVGEAEKGASIVRSIESLIWKSVYYTMVNLVESTIRYMIIYFNTLMINEGCGEEYSSQYPYVFMHIKMCLLLSAKPALP